ncbi:MAG TPA: SDR family oxidoreductase [Candidatus Krumholzibacteria bacterium]|nr:SDR family oxidoreductase [Candidatus Krumholzibacteria bacterium]HPD71527.1 SDR family oxidoreductase [Candidatus Krumholzibacteria bacterium]HRY41540.1 SDR family oxidoreductase [Candidatus Krumholzibacteria bacterium]
MARYVVTGGAGFIGSHVAEALAGLDHTVVVIDDLSTGHKHNLTGFSERITFVEGSITDLALLKRHFRDAEVVFHQAALASVPRSVADPLASNDVNVTGTLNVFLAARDLGVRRVVYAASSSAYGDSEVLPKREDMPARPLSPYAVTKYVDELYGKIFTDLYGLPTIGLRYFNVFGPRQDPESQYAAVVPLFITRFLAGISPTINGDGGQSRDFTYIDNVVHANLRAAAAGPAADGLVYNIACGASVTIQELCLEIRRLVGSEVAPTYGPSRVGDVRHSLADISQARRLLGYEPAVSLAAGLERTVAWYRANRAGGRS